MNKAISIGFVLIMILIVMAGGIMIYSGLIGGSQGNVGTGGPDAKQFQCRVQLSGDLFSDTDIVEQPSCSFTNTDCVKKSGTCSGLFSLLSDEGCIKFVGNDGVTYAETRYKIDEVGFDKKDFLLNGCTDVTYGEIKVISAEARNPLQDSADVKIR